MSYLCRVTGTMRLLLSILCVFGMLLTPAVQAQEAVQTEQAGCPIIKVAAERLPDLNIPRSGHSVFVANGEVTVVGGHTSGFVLTPTAEYFKDGEWHLLQTVYAHDGGFSVVLKSGKVLLAGGFKDNLGISQSFEVEMYDPTTHHFDGFGCLDQKRASATAIELDSGQVLITGNWYADDAMECFDGQTSFSHVKTVRQPRYLPHLFRTSDGDIMVLAGYDNKGQPIDSLMAERMKGEPFRAPLFETWHPLQYDLALHSDDSFIGDDTYLMPVQDKDGQMAIAEVCDTVFSLLPTDHPVPMAGPWGKISYYAPVYADRQHQRSYVMGCDSTGRQYALCIDYAQKPAKLTLFHTDPLTDGLTITIPVMTNDGNLVLTGIKQVTKPNFNFSPTALVWLLRFNDDSHAASASANHGWLWAALAFALLVLIIAGIALRRRRKQPLPSDSEPSPGEDLQSTEATKLLLNDIIQLIEDKKLYLNSEIKVSDVADALNVNLRIITNCLKVERGCSLTQLLKNYRIEHAKQLIVSHPELKMVNIAMESGYANERSFFRDFKQATGMTPSEWQMAQKD